MKNFALLSVAIFSMTSSAFAYDFIAKIETYLDNTTNKTIQFSSHDIDKKTNTAQYYDYALSKKFTVSLDDVSKSTTKKLKGVKAGELAVLESVTADGVTRARRACLVFHVFENAKAEIACRTVKEDYRIGYQMPSRFGYLIHDLDILGAEVESLDGFKKGQKAILQIDTDSIKAGKTVKIWAVLRSGEAIVQKAGLHFLDTSSIINKMDIEVVELKYLNLK